MNIKPQSRENQKSMKNNLKTKAAAILLICLSFTGKTMAGDKFSEPGNSLYSALLENIKQQNLCSTSQDCFNLLKIYREDGGRIHLNMYGQKNRNISSLVTGFIIKNGMTITKGKPITLTVFEQEKDQTNGIKSIPIKAEPSIRLEISK